MYQHFENNPCGKNTGDCAIRAISVALNTDWYTAFDILTEEAYQMCDMPSADSVWGSVLRHNGFKRFVLPNSCPDCYCAEDFCKDHPKGIYVLAFGGHVATVRDGILLDSWDSSAEIPLYYYYHE